MCNQCVNNTPRRGKITHRGKCKSHGEKSPPAISRNPSTFREEQNT